MSYDIDRPMEFLTPSSAILKDHAFPPEIIHQSPAHYNSGNVLACNKSFISKSTKTDPLCYFGGLQPLDSHRIGTCSSEMFSMKDDARREFLSPIPDPFCEPHPFSTTGEELRPPLPTPPTSDNSPLHLRPGKRADTYPMMRRPSYDPYPCSSPWSDYESAYYSPFSRSPTCCPIKCIMPAPHLDGAYHSGLMMTNSNTSTGHLPAPPYILKHKEERRAHPSDIKELTHVPTSTDSKVVTTTPRRYKCTVCVKRFTRPSSLATHMHSHTGEKPYKCNVEGCGRRFSVVSNLRRHAKIHSNSQHQ